MAQIAADCLETPMENIVVFSVDTDISPYDSGSYASSTTYTTGVAVMKACKELREKICELGAQMIEADPGQSVDFDGIVCVSVMEKKKRNEYLLEQIGLKGYILSIILSFR